MTTSPPATVFVIAVEIDRHGEAIEHGFALLPFLETNVRCESACALLAHSTSATATAIPSKRVIVGSPRTRSGADNLPVAKPTGKAACDSSCRIRMHFVPCPMNDRSPATLR